MEQRVARTHETQIDKSHGGDRASKTSGSPEQPQTISGSPASMNRNTNAIQLDQSWPKVGWHELQLQMPLSGLYSAALRTDNADLRSLAILVASRCLAATGSSLPDTEEANRGMILFSGGSPLTIDAALREMKAARIALGAYCSSENSEQFVQDMRTQGTIPTSSPNIITIESRSKQPDQEYSHALVQVLLDPLKYSFAFDRWTATRAPEIIQETHDLSVAQRHYLSDTLFRKFVPVLTDNGFRETFRCASLGVCPSSIVLSADEKIRTDTAVAQIEKAIRQQRWDLLRKP